MVLVVGDRRQRAERTLRCVLEQAASLNCEVIVVDIGGGEHHPLPGQDQPLVRGLQLSRNLHIGEARLLAVRAARGEIIAFLEDHVTIDAGFLPAVLGAFQDGWVAVGPTVQNANPDLGVSNAVHFLHYGLWNPLNGSGEAELIPGNNSAYRKSILEFYGDRLERLLLTDTVLQMRLRADQHRMYVAPSAQLNHLNATSLKTAVISEYLYHRCFVVARSLEFDWSRLERLWVLLRTPLTPWIRLFRLARISLSRYPSWRRRFLLALPSLIVLQHAAAWGQLVGLVLGQGAAPARFTEFETNYPRPTATD